jgi:hypothetical protein
MVVFSLQFGYYLLASRRQFWSPRPLAHSPVTLYGRQQRAALSVCINNGLANAMQVCCRNGCLGGSVVGAGSWSKLLLRSQCRQRPKRKNGLPGSSARMNQRLRLGSFLCRTSVFDNIPCQFTCRTNRDSIVYDKQYSRALSVKKP